MLFIIPGRRAKYQGKLAKMQYKDAKHQRHAQRAAVNRAKWAAMTPRQKWITAGVAAALVILLMILGHGSGTSTSYSMCEQIMAQKIEAGSTPLAGGAPDACNGLTAGQMAKALAAAKTP